MFAKSIVAPVGLGGLNRRADVMIVQYLLNCVHVAYGGPVHELVVDGLAGAQTIQAIHRFQLFRFGKSDGRVLPKSFQPTTIDALEEFDPYPGEPPSTCSNWSKKSGKNK